MSTFSRKDAIRRLSSVFAYFPGMSILCRKDAILYRLYTVHCTRVLCVRCFRSFRMSTFSASFAIVYSSVHSSVHCCILYTCLCVHCTHSCSCRSRYCCSSRCRDVRMSSGALVRQRSWRTGAFAPEPIRRRISVPRLTVAGAAVRLVRVQTCCGPTSGASRRRPASRT